MSKQVITVDLNSEHEYQRLLAGKPQTFGMKSGRVHLNPGQDCGQHSTDEKEEMLIFLSGNGLAVIGDNEKFNVGKGKISYIPPHTIHNIINTGSEPFIYIYCVVPVS
ncbi:MAG: cupin domain-containing protein [Planctomycetota bacterium]|jgi:mannose-6-phosphate isomerase-like protein (cupin superfamily)